MLVGCARNFCGTDSFGTENCGTGEGVTDVVLEGSLSCIGAVLVTVCLRGGCEIGSRWQLKTEGSSALWIWREEVLRALFAPVAYEDSIVVCFFRFPPVVFRLTRTSSLGGEREVGAAVAAAFFFALFFLSEGSTVMADSSTSSFPSRVRHSTLKWVEDD